VTFKEMCLQLETAIVESYTSGVSLEEAERLAGRFLQAQIQVSEELKSADLDSRMRKSVVKALKALVYSAACSKADKKPTETQLDHVVNTDGSVREEQDAYDRAEVERDNLERYYSIFREAHIHFRGVAKGTFGG
jgi:hypothetical protein